MAQIRPVAKFLHTAKLDAGTTDLNNLTTSQTGDVAHIRVKFLLKGNVRNAKLKLVVGDIESAETILASAGIDSGDWIGWLRFDFTNLGNIRENDALKMSVVVSNYTPDVDNYIGAIYDYPNRVHGSPSDSLKVAEISTQVYFSEDL